MTLWKSRRHIWNLVIALVHYRFMVCRVCGGGYTSTPLERINYYSRCGTRR